jgi:hypothetical protein
MITPEGLAFGSYTIVKDTFKFYRGVATRQLTILGAGLSAHNMEISGEYRLPTMCLTNGVLHKRVLKDSWRGYEILIAAYLEEFDEELKKEVLDNGYRPPKIDLSEDSPKHRVTFIQ